MLSLSLGPAVSVQRAALCLSNSLGGLGILCEPPPLANNSVECNSLPVLDVLYGNKRWPAETPYPQLIGELVRITFMCFYKFSLHWVSILFLQCLSIPDVSSCILSLDCSPSLHNPPVHAPSPPIKSVFHVPSCLSSVPK